MHPTSTLQGFFSICAAPPGPYSPSPLSREPLQGLRQQRCWQSTWLSPSTTSISCSRGGSSSSSLITSCSAMHCTDSQFPGLPASSSIWLISLSLQDIFITFLPDQIVATDLTLSPGLPNSPAWPWQIFHLFWTPPSSPLHSQQAPPWQLWQIIRSSMSSGTFSPMDLHFSVQHEHRPSTSETPWIVVNYFAHSY